MKPQRSAACGAGPYSRRGLCYNRLITCEATTMDLSARTCVPCKGGVPPLTAAQMAPLLAEVPKWRVIDGHHIERNFAFPDFKTALAFTNRVGDVAEAQGHHPDIHLSWGSVVVTIWTHKVGGLTESDFILAAKIDRLDA